MLAAVQKLGGAFLWFPSKPDSMQQWEGSGIDFVYVGKRQPEYADPLPRVRLLTVGEYLAQIPLDVIKAVLQGAGVTVTNPSDKPSCVAQLEEQGEAMHSKATQAWRQKQASSKAASKAPTKVSARCLC